MRHFVTLLTSAFENPYAEFNKEYDAKLVGMTFDSLSSIVSIGLGALVTFLSISAFIVTALDVAFLVIPLAHDKLEEHLDKRSKDGKSSSKFILMSKQAIDAYDEAMQSGINPLLVYLRKRLGYYIVLVVAIYFMITGWTQIVNIVAGFVVNILEKLGFI